MDEIIDHRVEPSDDVYYPSLNDKIMILPSGSQSEDVHKFEVYVRSINDAEWVQQNPIKFQIGPYRRIDQNTNTFIGLDINGISIEALLAICEHYLAGFQNGDFKCKENDKAIKGIDQALKALHSRTKDRVKRGVEGKAIQ